MKRKVKLLIGITFSIVFLLFLSIFLSNSGLGNGYYLYTTGGLHSGYTYLKRENYKQFFLVDIIETVVNDRYILAQRLPLIPYECPDNSSRFYEIPKVQYLIIDKIKHTVYKTFDYQVFLKKKHNLSIHLNFNQDRQKIIEKKIEKRKKQFDFQGNLYIQKNCMQEKF